MKRSKQHFVVIPVRLVKGVYRPAEPRYPRTEELALELAERLSTQYAGVAAFEVLVDTETGDMHDPRELVTYGKVPDLMAAAA